MKKFKLDIQYDYDFTLIGICSAEKEYRICWALNKQIGIELQKTENYFFKKSDIDFAEFSMYLSENEREFTSFYLVKNEGIRTKPSELTVLQQTSIPTKESLKEWLVPEEKQCDYFLLLKGDFLDAEKILSEIIEIPMVITAYKIDPKKLKSKQNLLF